MLKISLSKTQLMEFLTKNENLGGVEVQSGWRFLPALSEKNP